MPRFSRFSGARQAMLLALALLWAGSVVFVLKAEKPWGKTVSRRQEKHQELQPKEYAVIGLWWGALANAVLLAGILATSKRWMPRQNERETDAPPSTLAPKSRAAVWLGYGGLLVILAAAAWLRAPRLTHSLWNDEEYAMRKFAHGAWEQGSDGAWTFHPVSWTETLFENRNGNNHLLNSLITREALVVWRGVTGAPREAFSEAALRLPAFVAGLCTIAMIYLLGCRVTAARDELKFVVGLGAALGFALCPWHIRYAVEAKGYSFMLLFVCTAIYGLLRALEEDRLRWWLLFALSEAAFVLSFAGSVYVAAAVNLMAAIELLRTRQTARLGTLAAFNLLAVLPVLQWMLPSVPQLMNYLHSEGSLHLAMGWPWVRDFLSGVAIGFQFDNPVPAAHAGTSWLMETAAHPWLAWIMALAALLVVAGIIAALFENTAARLAIVAPVCAVVAAYAHNAMAGTPMVVWYLLYVIVPASLAMALSVGKFSELVSGFGRRAALQPVIPPVLMFGFLVMYLLASHGSAERLRDIARQPMREAVAAAHAQDGQALTAVLGVSDRQMQSYDPKVTVLENRKELASLVESARRAGHPLFIYVCGREALLRGGDEKLRSKQPVLEALDHGLSAQDTGGVGAQFSEVAHFPGTEAMFSYRVYELGS